MGTTLHRGGLRDRSNRLQSDLENDGADGADVQGRRVDCGFLSSYSTGANTPSSQVKDLPSGRAYHVWMFSY